jgi:hypothetical protein
MEEAMTEENGLSHVSEPGSTREAVGTTPQLGFDEQVIEDPEIEAILERRQEAKEDAALARKDFEVQHEQAVAKLAELELPDGGAARVGRFRITRKTTPARSVSFETAEKSRLSIGLADEEG